MTTTGAPAGSGGALVLAVLVATLALAAASPASAQEGPPPAAPADEAPAPAPAAAPAADDAPPLVELPPPAPAPADPDAISPLPAKPRTARPKPDPKAKHGIEPLPTAAVQMATGTGGCCVGCCIALPVQVGLGFIPVVGAPAASIAGNLIMGATIGIAEGAVGDAAGQQRSALVWPVVVSAGALLLGYAGTELIALNLRARGIEPPTDPTDQVALNRYLSEGGAAVYGSLAVELGAVLVAVVAPAVVYGLTAKDKTPGDTGQGLPGFFEPADPAPVIGGGPQLPPVAMRY